MTASERGPERDSVKGSEKDCLVPRPHLRRRQERGWFLARCDQGSCSCTSPTQRRGQSRTHASKGDSRARMCHSGPGRASVSRPRRDGEKCACRLLWADLVLVMERKYAARIRAAFPDMSELPPLESLEIPDEFEFMDEELVELLRVTVEERISLGAWSELHHGRQKAPPCMHARRGGRWVAWLAPVTSSWTGTASHRPGLRCSPART